MHQTKHKIHLQLRLRTMRQSSCLWLDASTQEVAVLSLQSHNRSSETSRIKPLLERRLLLLSPTNDRPMTKVEQLQNPNIKVQKMAKSGNQISPRVAATVPVAVNKNKACVLLSLDRKGINTRPGHMVANCNNP